MLKLVVKEAANCIFRAGTTSLQFMISHLRKPYAPETVPPSHARRQHTLLWSIFFSLWALLLLCCYGYAFVRSAVNEDAGYYLSVARALYQGETLFTEIASHYTPLMYFLLAPSISLGGYEAALGIIYLLAALSALPVYLLVRLLGGSQRGAFFGLLFYLFVAFALGAYQVLLEPLVNLFAAAALYFALLFRQQQAWRWLAVAGLCLALAFLSKQYGVLMAVPLALAVLLPQKKEPSPRASRLQALGWLGLFAGLPVLAGLLWLWQLEVDLLQLLQLLSGGGYGDHSLLQFLQAESFFLLKTAPFLCLLPFLNRSNESGPLYTPWLLLPSLLVFTLPLYIKTYPHYFLLQLPYLAVVAGLLVQRIEGGSLPKALRLLALLLLALPMGYYTYRAVATTAHIATQDREGQLERAQRVRATVGSSPTLLLDNYYLYYLARLEPPLKKELGYSFLNAYQHHPERVAQLLDHAQYIIGSKHTLDGHALIRHSLDASFTPLQELAPGLWLYRRSAGALPAK
jgi:4-amino-4-deoxy-L-arabinose transferase-like glycosyltransferase